jgi:hypothetical protein
MLDGWFEARQMVTAERRDTFCFSFSLADCLDAIECAILACSFDVERRNPDGYWAVARVDISQQFTTSMRL